MTPYLTNAQLYAILDHEDLDQYQRVLNQNLRVLNQNRDQ